MNPVMGSNLPAALCHHRRVVVVQTDPQLCEDWCTMPHLIPANLRPRYGPRWLNNLLLLKGFIRPHCEGPMKPANERLLFHNENHLIANKTQLHNKNT
jgi:hypothetical protein